MAQGAPERALDVWFASALRDYFALSHAGDYAPLAEVLEKSLPRTLAELGAEPVDAGSILGAFRSLDAAPGAAEAVEHLASADTKIVALTNGSESLTRGLVEGAGLAAHFSVYLSCDSIRVSKPHPRVYEMAKGVAEGKLWLVAAHAWDIAGARRARLSAAWISSKERQYPDYFPAPSVIAENLADAARRITG
jgi:2-haloacid dehalogenase